MQSAWNLLTNSFANEKSYSKVVWLISMACGEKTFANEVNWNFDERFRKWTDDVKLSFEFEYEKRGREKQNKIRK